MAAISSWRSNRRLVQVQSNTASCSRIALEAAPARWPDQGSAMVASWRAGSGLLATPAAYQAHLNSTSCATGSSHLSVKKASGCRSASASARISRRATPSRRLKAASASARQPAGQGPREAGKVGWRQMAPVNAWKLQ